MKDWRKASLFAGMLAGLLVASSGCAVAPDESLEEAAEQLSKSDAPDESSADEGDDDSATGEDFDLPGLEGPVDPIPWHDAFPGAERFDALDPDPVPWQPNTAGCSDGSGR